jgi:hypothetical protein
MDPEEASYGWYELNQSHVGSKEVQEYSKREKRKTHVIQLL